MLRFSASSIRRKLLILTAVSAALGLLLAAAALIAYAWFSALNGYQRDLETVTRIVGDNSTAALVFGDRKAAAETLAALRDQPEIRSACLYTAAAAGQPAELFAAYQLEGALPCPQRPEPQGRIRLGGDQIVVAPVLLKGETVGVLRVKQTLAPLRAALLAQIAITLVIMSLSFAVSLTFGWRMQSTISGPIVRLAETALRVSASRDYSLRAAGGGGDEVGHLIQTFNQMLDQVQQGERAIGEARDQLQLQVQEKTRANSELQLALERLRQTQAQLVQSEKLASLGALVAGIAHEINTPVGVGVTAASTLQAKAAQLQAAHESGAMRRSDLERFLAMSGEATRIILSNLLRAADLIQSFKQVAVDQSSGERRRFDLKAYLQEVLLSLGPRLRKGGHSVAVDCPAGLVVDSFPGALAQVVTNFIENSLLHGYIEGQHGRIGLQARCDDAWITLIYRDDGRGIAAENLARVFDPFFTTKRGSGGSGLGMHIVYNLVTQLLRGQIELVSKPGEGVRITVRFPAGLDVNNPERAR
jgi:signal transduction histidine kinase